MNENVKSEGPKREIFANKSFEETRIAIVEDGRLAELYWERESKGNIVGNIYKASVDNVLPGISSAFINVGTEKNAYIYISDVLGGQKEPIENLLRKDQEVMFITEKKEIAAVRDRFPEALAVDMESCSIAQTCFLYKVPFLPVRFISDTADSGLRQEEYDNFWKEISLYSFSFIRDLLGKI